MPELIKIYWRDIPSQVTAKAEALAVGICKQKQTPLPQN